MIYGADRTHGISGLFLKPSKPFIPLTKAERKTAEAQPKLNKEERILKYQKSAIKKFEEKIEKTEGIVAALYENYQFVSAVISTLDSASKTHSWQEMEKLIREKDSADAKKIVAFHPKKQRLKSISGNGLKSMSMKGSNRTQGGITI